MLKKMDFSETARLYLEGRTLREVAKLVNRSWPTVAWRLRRMGISPRPWDPRTGGAKYVPPVTVKCAFCETEFQMTQYDYRNGGGSNRHPRPAKVHFCSSVCRRFMIELIGGLRNWSWYFDR